MCVRACTSTLSNVGGRCKMREEDDEEEEEEEEEEARETTSNNLNRWRIVNRLINVRDASEID